MRVLALIGLLSGDVAPDLLQCGATYGELKIGIRIAPSPAHSVAPLPQYRRAEAKPKNPVYRGISTIYISYE